MSLRFSRRQLLAGTTAFAATTVANSLLAEIQEKTSPMFTAKRAMRRLPYVQVDVFAPHPLQGNQLGVFIDARGLRDDEMQALARETHFSETTFVLPRERAVEKERGILVRIFTPQEELPFAGHPTLGTAMVIRSRRPPKPPDELALELKVGKVPIRFHEDRQGRVFGEMRQMDPHFGEIHPPDEVARVIGVEPEEIASQPPIQTVSTGLPFALVPLKRLDTIRSLRLDWDRVRQYFKSRNAEKFTEFYFVTKETVDPTATLHARGLFADIVEDPATGSAAGCTGAWLVRHGVQQAEEEIVIEQGLEIQRPSRISVRAGINNGKVVSVRVSGQAIEVMHGEFIV